MYILISIFELFQFNYEKFRLRILIVKKPVVSLRLEEKMVIWIKVTTFSLQRRRCWNRLSKNEALAVYIRDNFLQAASNFATIPFRETSRQKYLALTYEIIKRKDSPFLRRHGEMRERIPVLRRGKERDTMDRGLERAGILDTGSI